MKTKIKLVVLILLFSGKIISQVNLGSIKGTVLNEDGKPIPGAKVWLEMEGSNIIVGTQVDGEFSIDALNSGVYNLRIKSTGMDTLEYNGIQVQPDQLTFLGDIQMQLSSVMGKVVVIKYVPPVLHVELERLDIPLEDIKHSINIQNPLAIITMRDSNIKMDEGTNQPIIRGSRPGDAIYYIDGVKSTSMGQIPGVAIGSMAAYTGGIPAKYGDTTGGVIILESKSYFDLYYAWVAGQ